MMPNLATKAFQHVESGGAYLKAFAASYALSNRLFPQTRFYFVIDFASRLDGKGIIYVIENDISIPGPILVGFACMANTRHRVGRIRKNIGIQAIQADALKMTQALRSVFELYSRGSRQTSTTDRFIRECIDLKEQVDNMKIDTEYRNFISPLAPLGVQEGIERSENVFLTSRLLARLPLTRLLLALRTEIEHPVWVLRPL